jgi:hypothetical protein
MNCIQDGEGLTVIHPVFFGGGLSTIGGGPFGMEQNDRQLIQLLAFNCV